MLKMPLILILSLGLFCGMFYQQKILARAKSKLAIGQKAPDFSLLDELGRPVKLSDYLGKNVILYFYPKDGTPNCTKQACSLRDNHDLFLARNITILGISYDSVKSHQKFKNKNKLNFKLLSDSDQVVSKLYGTNTGVQNYFFPKRMTFLINAQGILVEIFADGTITENQDLILSKFK